MTITIPKVELVAIAALVAVVITTGVLQQFRDR